MKMFGLISALCASSLGLSSLAFANQCPEASEFKINSNSVTAPSGWTTSTNPIMGGGFSQPDLSNLKLQFTKAINPNKYTIQCSYIGSGVPTLGTPVYIIQKNISNFKPGGTGWNTTTQTNNNNGSVITQTICQSTDNPSACSWQASESPYS